MRTGRVVVVHGYGAGPSNHWFPWLARELAPRGIVVDVPPMPAPLAPQVDAWLEALAAAAPSVDERTVLVGHSLGCITLLRHLSTLASGTAGPPPTLAGLLLVAGFDTPPAAYPQLASFTDGGWNVGAVIATARMRRVFASDNDAHVPPPLSEALAARLQAPLQRIAGAGHFLGSEGHVELPAVRDGVLRALDC